MTTSTTTAEAETDLLLDARDMSRQAITGFRVAFGIGGVTALILGIVLLAWPVKTVAVFAAVLGIFFIATGITRISLGIFSFGTSAGHRVLSIVLGLLILFAGIVAVKNPAASAATLVVIVIAVIGIAWIVDGIMTLVESKSASSRGWAIAYGIVGIVAGLFIVSVPAWSIVWLTLFGSVALIVLGILGVGRAFTFGRQELKDR